jgi:hypothetical protein
MHAGEKSRTGSQETMKAMHANFRSSGRAMNKVPVAMLRHGARRIG